jgi:hypothetical protein
MTEESKMFTPLDRHIRSYLLNKDNTNHIFISNGGVGWIVEKLEEEIKSLLPHGSGIDCIWHVNHVKDLVFDCHNSYHAMDQNGFYCGYVDFIVRIDLLTKDFDVEVCQQDIEAIVGGYEEYIEGDDVETNAPYLEDLGDYLHQAVSHNLEYYYAQESIKYLANDKYYSEMVRRAVG